MREKEGESDRTPAPEWPVIVLQKVGAVFHENGEQAARREIGRQGRDNVTAAINSESGSVFLASDEALQSFITP